MDILGSEDFEKNDKEDLLAPVLFPIVEVVAEYIELVSLLLKANVSFELDDVDTATLLLELKEKVSEKRDFIEDCVVDGCAEDELEGKEVLSDPE